MKFQKISQKLLLYILLAAVIVFSFSACTTFVAKDYPKYLVNNRGSVNLKTIDKISGYFLTRNTQLHTYKVTSFTAGAGNKWIVEMGKILDATLMSTDVQQAFGILQKMPSASSGSKSILVFDLKSYEFKNFTTSLSLKISLVRSEKEIFSKTYREVGQQQTGKVLIGGAFAFKNAVQQSTKLALDKILQRLILDINEQ